METGGGDVESVGASEVCSNEDINKHTQPIKIINNVTEDIYVVTTPRNFKFGTILLFVVTSLGDKLEEGATVSKNMAVLPKEFGYVVLAVVLYCYLNFWMARQVGKARQKYKVFYPTLYASESENKDAKLFNCVQRGHQSSLEMMPVFFILTTLAGLRHPIVAASLGLIYTITRYFFFVGYSTGDPQNRLTIGKFGFLALMGLMVCSVSSGIRFLLD